MGILWTEFGASRSWVQKFMARKGFSLRRRTSICQKLPPNFEEKLVEFQRFVIRKRQEKGYPLGQIGNADQTPVYFDMPSAYTVTKKGDKEVKILSAGAEKQRLTVMLCCTADGFKLPPYIVLKCKNVPKGENFPSGVIVRANEKGWMTSEMVVEWLKLVWFRRPGHLLKLKSLLVLDSYRGHITPAVKDAMKEADSDLAVIPGGMTSQLQPLDVCVNKPFKDQLKRFYTEW
jgi:hypothetical protein